MAISFLVNTNSIRAFSKQWYRKMKEKGNKRTKQKNEFHGQKENTFHSFVPTSVSLFWFIILVHCVG